MVGTIIYLAISLLVSLAFVLLGMRQIHSTVPVGMNTFEKPPREDELINMTEWNHKHGRNLIVYGCLLFITLCAFWLLLMIADTTVILLLLLSFAIIGELVWLEVQHSQLKKKLIRH